MHESEFIISLENRSLTISGNRQGPAEKGAYYQMEIPSGEFISIVELPNAVVYDKVEAIYQDGFLRVVLPKAIPSRIEVKK
jgi:HSP20 family protein